MVPSQSEKRRDMEEEGERCGWPRLASVVHTTPPPKASRYTRWGVASEAGILPTGTCTANVLLNV